MLDCSSISIILVLDGFLLGDGGLWDGGGLFGHSRDDSRGQFVVL